MPRNRALAALLLAVLTCVGIATPSSATSSAAPTPAPVGICAPGLGIGLLEVPRATLKDPRARNYVIDAVRPGATFSRKIQVCNGTKAPLAVSLYPDAATIADGAFTLAAGRGTNELTSWMSVSPASVTVPPGKAAIAEATFTVPDDASIGERYGAIVADSPAIGGAGGVAVGGRVGIRVYLSVSGSGAPKSDFTIDSLQAVRGKDGTPAVLAKVHNTGKRALDMTGSLQLSDGPAGLSAGPFAAKLGTTLAPGDTAPVVVPLDKAIAGGPWHAVITMKSGLLERRAEGDITFPDAADTASPAVVATELPLYRDRGILVPVAIGLLGLLALLLIVLFAQRALRSRRRLRSAT